MLSFYSSSSDLLPERLASPREKGRHPQFSNLLTKIDDQELAFFPQKIMDRT